MIKGDEKRQKAAPAIVRVIIIFLASLSVVVVVVNKVFSIKKSVPS